MPTTDDESTMTGDCFLECLKHAGYSINGVAKRWGVDPATVHREKEKPEARGLYADAARTLLREAIRRKHAKFHLKSNARRREYA